MEACCSLSGSGVVIRQKIGQHGGNTLCVCVCVRPGTGGHHFVLPHGGDVEQEDAALHRCGWAEA